MTSYLETAKGQFHRYRSRKRKKFLFHFDANLLLTKKSQKRNEEIRFQTSLIEHMFHHNKRMYRGDVIVTLHFFVAQNNPPAIQNLPKYYIDLLLKVHEELKPLAKEKINNSTHLLLKDDRQIKYLEVHYSLMNQTEGIQSTMYMEVEPMGSFYEDLLLSERIRDDALQKKESYGSEYSYRVRKFHDRFDEQSYTPLHDDDSIENFRDLLQQKDKYTADNKFAMHELLLFSAQQSAQRAYLRTEFLNLHTLQGLYSSRVDQCRPPLERKMMLSMPPYQINFLHAFSISLPGSPYKNDQKKPFLEEVKNRFQAHFGQSKLMSPLVHPIRVTIFTVPPAAGGKDLDNLALDLVPLIHEVLKPPTWKAVSKKIEELTKNARAEAGKDPKPEIVFKGLSDFKGAPTMMVTGYTVAELPRTSSTSKDGAIYVLLEDGSGMESTCLDYLKEYLKKWADCFY